MVATNVSLTGSEESFVDSTVSVWSGTLSARCAFDDTITGSMCLLLQPPARGVRSKMLAWDSSPTMPACAHGRRWYIALALGQLPASRATRPQVYCTPNRERPCHECARSSGHPVSSPPAPCRYDGPSIEYRPDIAQVRMRASGGAAAPLARKSAILKARWRTRGDGLAVAGAEGLYGVESPGPRAGRL